MNLLSITLSPQQRAVYDDVYNQQMDIAFNAGRTKTDAGERSAHWAACDAALTAARRSARPINPTTTSAAATATGLRLLDKPTFKLEPKPVKHDIFDAVVKGENEANFRRLELMARTMCEKAVTDHILLLGPPSVGKTMTATILARAIERPLLMLSGETLGSDLLGVIQGPLTQLYNGAPYSETYRHPDNKMAVNRIKPTTLFVDEVHAMSPGIQTSMLMATEGDCRVPLAKGGYIDFQDVLFIFGTTEPNLLSKPLRTRFTNISMVHYSIETVAAIVRKKYPQISKDDSMWLARCSKLYPREALRLAKQAVNTRMPINLFITTYVGADEQGLDATDRKLLEVLESKEKYKSPQKIKEAQLILAQREKFSSIQIVRAEALLNTKVLKPMFFNALADALMITDQEEIRTRVHYLETLGLVIRTPSGVVRQF